MPINLNFYSAIAVGDAQWVIDKLQSQPGTAVEVRINSPGGNVATALAIFNALKPRRPTVFIDGVAASSASVIAMAGHRIVAAENALLMIHNPWVETADNADGLRRTADALDMHRDSMVMAYERTGIGRDELLRLLAAETWLSATDALRLGFVDEISEPLAYAAHTPDCFSAYHQTPLELLNMPQPRTPSNATPPATPPANPGTPQDVLSAATAEVLAEQRHRNEQILGTARQWPGDAEIRGIADAALADPSMSFDRFGQDVLAALGRRSSPLGGGMAVAAHYEGLGAPGSGMADFVSAASDALVMRAGIRVAKPHAGARDVAGMSLSDIMRASVSRSGRSGDLASSGRAALVQAAMSTSDFPAILENTLGKALRAGYEADPATYEAWTRRVLVPDFKQQSRVLLGSAPQLLPVAEGAEYKYGSMDEDKSVPYSVQKFGRLVQLTWEALVNDDLGAFLRITQAMGQAAARAEADAVYATFAENAGAGATMQDSKALFHVDHKNLAAAASGINAAALGSGRVLLRRQTAVGGGALNLPPRFLLVAPEHEQAAEALLAAAARSLSQGEDNALVPAWLAQLQLIVEARLDDSSFWLLTSPDTVDTLERAHLEEDNGPRITEDESFKTDARTYKVRHVFGARWLDWRGAVKVPLSGS